MKLTAAQPNQGCRLCPCNPHTRLRLAFCFCSMDSGAWLWDWRMPRLREREREGRRSGMDGMGWDGSVGWEEHSTVQ